MNFPCYKCGLCCTHVNVAEATRFLDRGDGICYHYNDAKNLCSIYEDRPDICRVDKQYTLNYSHQYSWEDFVQLNLLACELLKNIE